jgi:hypothetical protein
MINQEKENATTANTELNPFLAAVENCLLF